MLTLTERPMPCPVLQQARVSDLKPGTLFRAYADGCVYLQTHRPQTWVRVYKPASASDLLWEVVTALQMSMGPLDSVFLVGTTGDLEFTNLYTWG